MSNSTALCTVKDIDGWPPSLDSIPNCTFLSILQQPYTWDKYLGAYCVDPPEDNCPFGLCPQPDVGGMLIRISAYVTTLCLAILMFYSHKHEEVKSAYWSQNFTTYAILIGAFISVLKDQLTKFHAMVAIQIVGSPLLFYMAIYAIRTFFGNKHRLDVLMGKGNIGYSVVAVTTLVIWIACVFFTLLPYDKRHFAQFNCESKAKEMFLRPFKVPYYVIEELPIAGGVTVALWILTIAGWTLAVWLRYRELWYRTGTRKFPGVMAIWEMVGTHYPFTHFMLVYVFPFAAWVLVVELGLQDKYEAGLDMSFGQILPIVVAVQPVVSVLKMLPRFGQWFYDLAWIRLVTGRKQRSSGYPGPPSTPGDPDTIPLKRAETFESTGPMSAGIKYSDPFHDSPGPSRSSTYDMPALHYSQPSVTHVQASAPEPNAGRGAYMRVDARTRDQVRMT